MNTRNRVVLGRTLRGQTLIRDEQGRIRKVWGVRPPQRQADLPILKVVEIRESTKSMERLNYNPTKEVLAGAIQFQVSPVIPEADLEKTGELTKRSIYYGVVLKSLVDFLNKNFKNFTDHAGNEFMNMTWEAQDIGKIQFISETFGFAEVSYPDADLHLMNLSMEAKLIRNRNNQLKKFQARLARRACAPRQVDSLAGTPRPQMRVAALADVAEAFAQHKLYSIPSGSFALMGGVAYSYDAPIAIWAEGPDGIERPYLDLDPFSATTRSQQNSIIRALAELDIHYEKVSHDELLQMLRYKAPAKAVARTTKPTAWRRGYR